MRISYESFFTVIRIVKINNDCVFFLHQLLQVYFVLVLQNTELFLQDISRFLFTTWSNNVSLPSSCLVACNFSVWTTTSILLYNYFIVQLLWINASPKSGYVHGRTCNSSVHCVLTTEVLVETSFSPVQYHFGSGSAVYLSPFWWIST